MANFILDYTTTSAQTLIDGEFGFLSSYGNIAASNEVAITSTGFVDVMILGSVVATNRNAYYAADGAPSLVVGATGSMTSFGSDAINITFTSTGDIYNHGTVTSITQDGVDLRTSIDSSINFTNTGTVSGGSDALVIGAGAGTVTVGNSGTLTATDGYGIALDVGSFVNPMSVTIVNSGWIVGSSSNGGAMNGGSYGITLINTGTMIGKVLMGDDDSIYRGQSGVLSGLIDGEGGNDLIRTGAGEETLFGSTGDDTLLAGAGDDVLDGGSGNDRLFGGEGHDQMTGGFDLDVLRGREGDDTISGDDGNDTAFGGVGDDEISGGTGKDMLVGGAGDDLLMGDGFSDTLNGGTGDDTLDGGAGGDLMKGGAGADVFVYHAVTDSRDTVNADEILDFSRGSDTLDLSAVASGMAYVGKAAFSGGGQGSVNFAVTASGISVFVDANGDALADMRIDLDDLTGFAAGNLLL